jgi:hypothetical protein
MGAVSLLNLPVSFPIRQRTISMRACARALRWSIGRCDKEHHRETPVLEKPVIVADAAIIGLIVLSLMRFRATADLKGERRWPIK